MFVSKNSGKMNYAERVYKSLRLCLCTYEHVFSSACIVLNEHTILTGFSLNREREIEKKNQIKNKVYIKAFNVGTFDAYFYI